MIKKIAFFTLLISLSLSINAQIITDKYLKVYHKDDIKIVNIYSQIIFETKNDTPYSEQIKFNEGWSRYYDWMSKKFIPKENGSNRISPLINRFYFNSDKIYDSEYSVYKILSSKDNSYTCIDNSNQNCILSIISISNRKYIIIDYPKYSYIYGTLL